MVASQKASFCFLLRCVEFSKHGLQWVWNKPVPCEMCSGSNVWVPWFETKLPLAIQNPELSPVENSSFVLGIQP